MGMAPWVSRSLLVLSGERKLRPGRASFTAGFGNELLELLGETSGRLLSQTLAVGSPSPAWMRRGQEPGSPACCSPRERLGVQGQHLEGRGTRVQDAGHAAGAPKRQVASFLSASIC